jgi:hypothetical protein
MLGKLLNRRQFVGKLGVFSALAIFGIAAKTQAQDTPTATPQGIKSKQGSWFAEFTTSDGRQFHGFTTFTPNGGLIASGQNDMRVGAMQSIGHGKWVQNGRQVDALTLKFVFNEQGRLVAYKETFSTGELDETGDLFTGTTTVKTYDVEGKLTQTEEGTIKSRRLGMQSVFSA